MQRRCPLSPIWRLFCHKQWLWQELSPSESHSQSHRAIRTKWNEGFETGCAAQREKVISQRSSEHVHFQGFSSKCSGSSASLVKYHRIYGLGWDPEMAATQRPPFCKQVCTSLLLFLPYPRSRRTNYRTVIGQNMAIDFCKRNWSTLQVSSASQCF